MSVFGSAVPSPGPAAEQLCPFCRSARVTTTSKVVSDTTYWRCHECGQVWNPSRLVSRPPQR